MTRLNIKTFAIAAFTAAMLAMPTGASAGDETIASGTFVGKSNHVTSGTVSVVKTDSGTKVVLESDFDFDGAPDPKLGFGKNGYDKSSQFSVLKANKGEQSYEIPASINPENYNEVWVWCEQYSVPLGVAKLK